jgi:DNA-binding GntR family transcriptional regulator
LNKLSNFSELARKEITNAILAGNLRLGQKINQKKLADMLNMSRTPLREALVSLEKEGLIVREERGYSICYLEKSEVDELYDTRKLLEGYGAYLCTLNITETGRKELRNHMLKVEMLKNTEENDYLKKAEMNGKIHEMIAEYSNNRYLLKYTREIRLKLSLLRVALFTIEDREEEDFIEHSEIVNAILLGDAKEARRKMEEHQDNVLDYVKKKIIPKFMF